MGTRADFYVGKGPEAEWLGSFAWDGYPDGPVSNLFRCQTLDEWRAQVRAFLEQRKDGTLPEHGWPWPWEDSRLTDYAYTYDDGSIWYCAFGYAPWKLVSDYDNSSNDDEDDSEDRKLPFPDMSHRQRVRFDAGSGLVILSS